MHVIHQKRSTDDRVPVLHFTNSMLWGGVEAHICGLLRHLSRGLFRPQLVCDPVLYERFRNAIPADIDITPVALSSPGHVGSAVRFANLLRREHFQIVHSHMFWSSLFASPIAWACRVPVVVETLHGTEAWRTGWKASGIIDRTTTRFVSRYVAVCDSDARFLESKKHVPAKKISIIYNGVDTSHFAVPKDARNTIRQSLTFSENDLVLIMVARFHAGKGHRVLFDAMCQLLDIHPTVKLLCVGEGEGEPKLRALCKELGLAARVRLVGYQHNVPEWLAAADINVLPSFYEGFPLTVLEAMASGLPTVASDVGGIPEAVENGVSGLLVPPGDSHKLAEALSMLLREPARRMQMGHAARQRLMQSFVLEQQVSSTENMYLELCGVRIVRDAKNTSPQRLAQDPRSSARVPVRIPELN